MREFAWDEYVNLGVINAIEVVREVSETDKINTLGYCLGGIILTTAALVLQQKKLDYINSMGHMTVMLDHAVPGDISYFIDKELLALETAQKFGGGIMSGKIIAQTFSALRANEMIWSYWINNYLLGKTPDAFDILYWNNDSADLPVLMHEFLLKRLYLGNELVHGKLVIDGIKMQLTKLALPTYIFAAQKDHIVPWQSAFKSLKYLHGPLRFVLGASGHTAGVVNPVSANKRNYWVNDDITATAEDWFLQAKEISGSWWKDYNNWLTQFSGPQKSAPKNQGNVKYKPLMDAPGEYVLAKAMPIPMSSYV